MSVSGCDSREANIRTDGEHNPKWSNDVPIDKLYFPLMEVATRWGVTMEDLAYLAENGLLRVSVRLFGAHLEEGVLEDDARGEKHRVVLDRRCFTGLQDLSASDAFKVFSEGEALVAHFHAPGDAYVALVGPTGPVLVTLKKLVVRREERDRVEQDRKVFRRPALAEPRDIQHAADYRQVQFGDLRLTLGRLQARIVRRLHEAARTGDGWCCSKSVLIDSGSASKRLHDVFKSQPRWRDLIESDGHRRCRLRIQLRSATNPFAAAE
jgi:hypothetical protein